MNKIKAKVNAEDQFSPWEESFFDLNRSFQLAKKNNLLPQLNTIQAKRRHSDKKEPSTQTIINTMNRTSLNLSKINLHAPCEDQPEPHSNRDSRRYLGPRITFYAKMNPRAGSKSRSKLDIEEEISQFTVIKKQLTSRLVRDDSIKYLQIIDENSPSQRRRYGMGNQYILPRMSNNRKISVVKARQCEQQQYIKRLKIIYNSRKH